MKSIRLKLFIMLLAAGLLMSGCFKTETGDKEDYSPEISNTVDSAENDTETTISTSPEDASYTLDTIPEFSGDSYVELNDNQPLFSDDELSRKAFEKYSDRDRLNRCGVAYANICPAIMPEEERGAIGSVKPSGWHTVKYNDLIEGNYLYNRCHLIGYQLSGENANEDNLITGTRFLNVEGMLPFENMVSDYVETTGNHVLYRVTPIFEGKNLVASGVTMEGLSVEDDGRGICFYVYVYNAQPGIVIDYKTGDSRKDPDYTESSTNDLSGQNNGVYKDKNDFASQKNGTDKNDKDLTKSEQYPNGSYILNTNTNKFHKSDCKSVEDMSEDNKKVSNATREEIINQGYEPCKRCNP